MKFYKSAIILILFLCQNIVSAQVIKGIVCDYATKQPLSDVYVYLDGTSINTITTVTGKFELTSKSVINTQLVLHHISYETTFIEHPFGQLPDTIFIQGKVNTIREVAIHADRFTREQKLKAFREQFLGTSRAGKSCTIENEEDIQLRVDMQSRRLLAYSDKPVVVTNNYLGYKVTFILVDFWAQYGYSIVSLDNEYVQRSYFAVVSSFIDILPDDRKIKRRRDKVFEQSSNHFFKSLAQGDLKENNFKVFNKSLAVDPYQYFAINDTLTQKRITIIPNTGIPKVKSFYTGPKLSGIFNVLQRNKIQSDIYFMTESFLVDGYGNIDQIDKISFKGKMGENRAGDLLPMDYELKEK